MNWLGPQPLGTFSGSAEFLCAVFPGVAVETPFPMLCMHRPVPECTGRQPPFPAAEIAGVRLMLEGLTPNGIGFGIAVPKVTSDTTHLFDLFSIIFSPVLARNFGQV